MAKSRTIPTKSFAAHPSEHLEGGWGIVVVAAAHVNMALMLGLQRCFGVLYLSWKNEFDTTARETAAVQSIMSSMSCFSVIIGGVFTKRYGSRISGILGGFLIVVGLFCSCWVSSMMHLYIAAATAGLGLGISFNSAIVAVAEYFKKKYKTAHAVAYSGMGTGIMALPPLLQLLLDSYGWRGAILILSAIMANVIACGALYRPSTTSRSTPKAPAQIQITDTEEDAKELEASLVAGEETSSFSNASTECKSDRNGCVPPNACRKSNREVNLVNRFSAGIGLNVFVSSYRLTLLCLLQTEINIPYMAFVQFIIPRAEDLGVASSSAALLISLLGIGGLLGRLGNGLLISSKVSAENVIVICLVLAGISCLLPTSDSYICLAIASFLQGFTVGAFHAIQIVLIRSFVGMSRFALSTGLCHLIVGMGVLSGPVIAGWLFDVTASYETVFSVQAGIYFFCALQMLLSPLLKRIEPGIDVESWDK